MLDATVKRISLRGHALCAVFLAAIGFVGFAVPKVTAQADSRERILSFQVTARVQPNSTLDVEETIRVRASGAQIKHGILRDFPTEYQDRTGARIVGFQVKSVLRDGKLEPYTVGPWQNGQRVKIGRGDVDLAPGEHTYVITYNTDHQLGFFPTHDELYWNVTGFWQFEIEQATAQVVLPEGVPFGKIRVIAYTGPQGARGTAWVAKVTRSGTVGFATTAPLKPNQGLTIVVGWPKGFVSPPPPRTETASQPPSPGPAFELKPGWWKVNVIRDAGGLAMASAALGLLFIFLAAWQLVGRDPAGRSVTILYEPPEHLSPAAMRYLRILNTDPKTFTSAVLSLASKKYLTIKKEDSGYALTRTGQQPDSKLSADEEAITRRLFTDDEAAKLAKAQYKAQMQDLSTNHPDLVRFMGGLASLAGPEDDGNTTRLGRCSPRIQGSFQALQDALNASFPPGSILKTHIGFVVFGTLYTVAATIASLYIYPEAFIHWRDAPLAIVSMVFNIASVMVLSNRLAALLPVESFAPARSTGIKVANAIGAVIAAAFAIATGWVVAMATSLEWAAAFAAMWLGLGMFQRLLKAPTEIGQKFWDEIEGFRRFLSETDQDRLDRMNPPQKTPALFERILPYAVALDCENAWAKQFENVLAMAAATQSPGATSASLAPAWYSGPRDGIADLTSFTSSFSSSFNNAIASSTAVPGSSSGFSSSSGGGGGSSGGGGGGGGGGGW